MTADRASGGAVAGPSSRAGEVSTRETTRTKAHVNVGVLGQFGHGKTALTAALDRVLARHGGGYRAIGELDDPPVVRARGFGIAMSRVEYETPTRHYAHVDLKRHRDVVKALVTGAARLDAAILVVSAAEGPMPQTRAQVRLARRVGVAHIIVYLNESDSVDDAARLDLVEAEVRALLDGFGYPGHDTPVVRGSALAALDGDQTDLGEGSILKLADALDRHIPEPERAIDGAFLMPVEDVFSIAGRGTLVTGRVERGVVRLGDDVEIVGIRDTVRTKVTGIEMFRKRLDEGVAGDNIGVALGGVRRKDVERGQVLAKPGTATAHTRFECEVYVLETEEGGRGTPFFDGYRPQFYFRTTDVTGTVELPPGTDRVLPGDQVALTVSLRTPIAMRQGARFAIREAGRTVGAGVVSAVLE